MASFEYKGLNAGGKQVKGLVDADNVKMARARLKRDGIFVTEIRDKKADAVKKKVFSRSQGGSSVPVQDMALMTRQLAVLVKSQIPLVDALTALTEQVENPTLKSTIGDIKQMVNEGSSFHKALGKYPKIFNTVFVTMCEAGEMSGTLDIILIRLSEFIEKQNTLRTKVKSAMMYPIIMVIFGTLVMIVLFVVVVPKITKIFEDLNLALPWYTNALISFSTIIADYYIYLGILGFGAFLFFQRWKVTPNGRLQWDRITMNLPVFGNLVRKVAVSRFAKTLSTLLAGGVPMLSALDIVKHVVDNKVYEKIIVDARDSISEGESVAGPLKKSNEFPPMIIHMIAIGEKTGELESMLNLVADSYEFEVDSAIGALTASLQPVMIVVMGGVIGFIVMAILVPIFQMVGDLGGGG